MFARLTSKSLLSAALAALVGVSAITTAPQPAEARRGVGLGLGIAGAIIAGAAISSYAYGYPRHYRYSRYYVSDNGCYLGPRQCRRTGGDCAENRFGDVVCRGGTVRCHRPTICD
jgi:hypothetical protein